MNAPTDNVDGLLLAARAARKKLADELDYARELLREEESLEVDLQHLVVGWNRARTALALAVFGEPTLPDGGLDGCEAAITERRRYADLEQAITQARSDLRYLEESPSRLAEELSELITAKRERVALLESKLGALTPPVRPVGLASGGAGATPAPAVPVATAAAAPKDVVASSRVASRPGQESASSKESSSPSTSKSAQTTQPKRCGVCRSPRGRFERFEDRWCCADCLHLEREIAAARRALAALNARPLEHSVSAAGEVAGVARIRAEGREALHALATRRSMATTPTARAASRVPARNKSSGGKPRKAGVDAMVDDLRQRWNSRP